MKFRISSYRKSFARHLVVADSDNILISLEPRHAQNIYVGTKTVELRRRTMHVVPGAIMWIYEKVPVGSITGSALVNEVRTDSPEELWSQFGSVSGLSKSEFFGYFEDATCACALVLSQAKRLEIPLSLSNIREQVGSFQPPQFFLRLMPEHPVLGVLKVPQIKKRQKVERNSKDCVAV